MTTREAIGIIEWILNEKFEEEGCTEETREALEYTLMQLRNLPPDIPNDDAEPLDIYSYASYLDRTDFSTKYIYWYKKFLDHEAALDVCPREYVEAALAVGYHYCNSTDMSDLKVAEEYLNKALTVSDSHVIKECLNNVYDSVKFINDNKLK